MSIMPFRTASASGSLIERKIMPPDRLAFMRRESEAITFTFRVREIVDGKCQWQGVTT